MMEDIFAQRLTECRERASLTQLQAAACCNLSKKTYQGYELGLCKPRFATLIKVALAYEVSIDYLLGRVDDPTPYPRPSK